MRLFQSYESFIQSHSCCYAPSFNFHTLSNLVAAVALIAISCSKHDPYYDDVTPPEIEPAVCNISGLVTNKEGTPLVGATISFPDGSYVTTDESGIYRTAVYNPGQYSLTAHMDAYIDESASLEVPSLEKTQQYVLNFVLSSSGTIVIKFLKAEDNLQSEAIVHNNVNGSVTISAETVSQAISEFENLYIMPVYSKKQAEVATKSISKEEKLLVGINLFSSDPDRKVLNEPIEISFDLNSDTQRYVRILMFKDGVWVAPEQMSYTEDKVTITTKDLTSYGVFCDVDVERTEMEIPLSYELDDYNNLYGSAPMHVESSKYSYKVGVELDTYQGTDQLRALLLEKLAQDCGLYEDVVDTEYPINVDLPVGVRLTVSGGQYYENVSYSRGGRTVSAKVWRNTWTEVKTYNRTHTGGGSLI